MTHFELPVGRPALMGVLNVTPDSFSDGGHYFDTTRAIERGLDMVDEGADLIDVGGESTRPNADEVTVEEELRRVLPVVRALSEAGVSVSIDTSKAIVARESLAAGAVVTNDVTAFSDPKMPEVCASAGCTVCLMHMQGNPRTMQASPSYDDVVNEVRDFLMARALKVESMGVQRNRIWIDPGLGFGKTLDHNLSLLRHLSRIVETGYPVLIGASRKSFIGRILAGAPVEERLFGSLAAQVLAQSNGAKIIRAHDCKEARNAMLIAQAILDT